MDKCIEHKEVCVSLAKIETQTSQIPLLFDRISELNSTLHGNGHRGICERVRTVEEYIDREMKNHKELMAAIRGYSFRVVVTILAVAVGVFFNEHAQEWIKFICQ